MLLWFAFPIDHPRWAKGNFLVFLFWGQKGDFISGISPPSIQFPADSRDIPNFMREDQVSGRLATRCLNFFKQSKIFFSLDSRCFQIILNDRSGDFFVGGNDDRTQNPRFCIGSMASFLPGKCEACGKKNFLQIPQNLPFQSKAGSYFNMFWTPAFAGVTAQKTFYEIIKF